MMVGNGIDKTLADFGQELTLIENRAKEISNRFEALQRQAEFLKMESLERYLEEQRKDVARSRGFRTLANDKRKMRDSFYRSVPLPSNVNADKIEASFEDGILEVTLPKSAKVKPKKIAKSAKKKAVKAAR